MGTLKKSRTSPITSKSGRAAKTTGKARGAKAGFLVTFEGGEGAGKSTQMRQLVAWLKSKGFTVTLTLEPGGTTIGHHIRTILLDPAMKQLCPRAELLLYQADRAQHIEELVRPCLASGQIVVSDRFADSSTVYQGICRKMGVSWVETLNNFATGGLQPDLVILLDVPTDVGMNRVRKRIREDLELQGVRRRVKLDRLEREKESFHRQVRKGFLHLAKRHPRRFAVIDATQSEQEISLQIQDVVISRLTKKGLWNHR